mgnify:CR=1 FL=1
MTCKPTKNENVSRSEEEIEEIVNEAMKRLGYKVRPKRQTATEDPQE